MYKPFNNRLNFFAATCFLQVCLLWMFTPLHARDAFPASLPHGFGAAFAEAGQQQDEAPRGLQPGQVLIEVDPDLVSRTSRWAFEPQETAFPDLLNRIVAPLETITELSDGRIVSGNGTGFAIGNTLLTAFHNMQLPDRAEVINHFTLLGGQPVSAREAFPDFDIAIVDIPDALCSGLCNQPVAFADLHDIYPDQTVSWLHIDSDASTHMQARVIGFASLSAAPDSEALAQDSCAENLVVLVDLPFQRGSSGGPVVDEKTGKILGMVQGTLSDMTLPSGIASPGFFKPMACLSELFKIRLE